MPILNEFSFTSCDCKSTIYVRQWLPDFSPIGVVQICHGVSEHIGRYDELAQFLASKGFVVAGEDHLGHGKSVTSPANQSHFGEHGGWELVVGDMRKLYERLREQYFSLPIFIFGHSMGSFLTRTYIIRYHDGPDGVIICGTGQQSSLKLNAGISLANGMIKKNGSAFKNQRLASLLFSAYNRHFKPNQTAFDWLTRDSAAIDEFLSDTNCGVVPSAALFRDMLTGIKYISSPKNLDRMNTDMPIYFISGDNDPIGDFGKGVLCTYNAFLKAGLSDVTLKLYHGARHDLPRETNKDEVFEDVLTWLLSKCRSRELQASEAKR